MTNPPAGWYQDPSGAPRQRFWDGQQWTNSFDPPREEKPPAPKASAEPTPKSEPANILPVWANLQEFSAFEVPEDFAVTHYMRQKIAEQFADPNADTSSDSPLLAAMAYAIFNLEANTMVNLMNANTQILRIKRAFFDIDSRLVAAGLPPADPDLVADLEEPFQFEWN